MAELVNTAIVPLWRYSAAFADYSMRDLELIGRLWNKGYRTALRLYLSTASALFTFPESAGGLERKVPRPLLVQEIELLFNQCTVRANSTAKVVKDWIRRDILALGAATSAEAQMDLGLAGGDHTRFGSPWYLFLYLEDHS